MGRTKRLVAGPWVGEFGWELMSWQGLVRRLAVGYDEVIVSAPARHEPYYADFFTQYLPHSIKGKPDCWYVHDLPPELRQLNEELRCLGGQWVKPSGYYPIDKQKFIKFGDASRAVAAGAKYDVVLHARGEMPRRAEASWPLICWNDLVEALCKAGLRVAAIGTTSWCPEGADDKRGMPEDELMDMLSACTLALGPSSGPMHLASLCGTPHIVWTDSRYFERIRATNRTRYERIWNPLNTPVKILDQEGWRPRVATVLSAVQEGVKEWKKA